MTPEDLAVAVRECVLALQAEGALAGQAPDEVVIERPKNRDHGDYATPVALTLAKSAGRPPREIADLVAARLGGVAGVAGEYRIGFVERRLGAREQGGEPR